MIADNEYNEIITHLADDSTGTIKMSLGSILSGITETITGKINGKDNLLLSLGNTEGYTYNYF
ncbi:hypothetical protein U2444_14940, partial [Listeria monocytogenes]|uniref:hypothetical protein n=1 Tax=Listeria monocytogenes TaxID=1639 RepID=UPI003B77F014